MRQPGESARSYRERMVRRPWARRFLRLTGPEEPPQWLVDLIESVLWLLIPAILLGLLWLKQRSDG